MQAVSILGLIVLLGLAWAMSYHRRDVSIRTVVWGIGLQLVFALIILREDMLSFVGMAILATLIVAYLLQRVRPELGGPLLFLAAAVCVAAIGGAYTFVPTTPQLWVWFGLLLFLVANAKLGLGEKLQLGGTALLAITGTACLFSRQMNGQAIFQMFTDKVAGFLSLSDYGAAFLFGNLANAEHFFPGSEAGWPGFGFLFAFKVLPTIVFFGGFMGVLYYLGIMQRVIEAFSRFMRWTIGTSGAETLSCSANIFVGQTEAPLLIRPFLSGMTRSELLTVMVGGFATIAGGVLAGYIAMGVPAGHLIAASVMSAPAALVVGKIIFPEMEQSQTAGEIKMPDIPAGDNVIEAASNGITDGLKLAVNVGAMLLGFIALIAILDVILSFFDGLIDGRMMGGEWVDYPPSGMTPVLGEYLGIFPGSLQTLFGNLLKPLAWLMGVPWHDAAKVGNLLGVKLSLNEFVAFGTLGNYIQAGELGERATIISTYALCGFANFSSIGIQIGGMAALAPERRSDLASVGLRAMFGGAIASWLTATIAGILL